MNNSVRELRIRDLIDSLTAGVSVRSVDGQHMRPAVLKTSAISKGRFDPTEAKTILSADIFRARCNPKCGSILVSRMNTPALVGEVGYVDRDFDELFLPDRLWLARARSGVKVDMRWLTYYLSSDIGSMAIRDLASGTSGSMKNIPKAAFLDLSVPTPTLKEQQKIALMLGDVDSLIASLERLIAKKRDIMKGLMQQLLTGKTRLPGFAEPWRDVMLGDHVSYVKTVALSRAQLDTVSSLRYLHYGDIHTRDSVRLNATMDAMPRASHLQAGSAGLLKVGDLVFADASEDPAGVGKSVEIVAVPAEGVVPGLHTIAARFDKTVLTDGFKAYLQFIPTFRESLLRLAAGTKVLATTRTYISSITLSLPQVDEQRAITQVIMDADEEIDRLQSRLFKARAIKQGMMQELLTGRTRLSVVETAS